MTYETTTGDEDSGHQLMSDEVLGKDEAEAAPIWEPDSAGFTCKSCDEPFSFIKRRHHCRRCGNLVSARANVLIFVSNAAA